MASPMRRVNEMVSASIGNTLTNIRTWNGIGYNVKEYGLVGDGITDDTAALQALVDKANDEGRKLIFFPHGAYYVTGIMNDGSVVYEGDNAYFVGGYTRTIQLFGYVDFEDVPIDGGNFTDPYLNPIINGGTF